MRLLIVEDENQIAVPLKKGLENEGFAVDIASDGKEGYEMATLNQYDCILLDLNLPEMDGIEVAQKLRAEKFLTPILMVTARSNQQQIWEGFENGTDDYIVKPFDFKELVYRVRAIIKRNAKKQDDVLEKASLKLNPSAHKVEIDSIEIKLNNKEFGILEYLLRNQGRLVSAEELLEHVWDQEIDLFTQTVRTNVKTLRKKVDPDKKLIKTVIGKGYLIE